MAKNEEEKFKEAWELARYGGSEETEGGKKMNKKLILTVQLKGKETAEWKFDFVPEINIKEPTKDDHYLAHIFDRLSKCMKKL